MSKHGLGKGLGALLDDSANSAMYASEGTSGEKTTQMPVGKLKPSTIQPRHYFDDDALKALAGSIKSQGVLQPLLVRPIGDMFEIIAGERRWRASQLAGLETVPVLIREMEDGKALEIALVENVQRADLNPIDEAEGYLRLTNEFNYTHEQLAKVTGKSRSHITNLLRLLSLPAHIKECVSNGLLTMGHARALLGVADDEKLQIRLANRVVKNSLSVRETEDIVRAAQAESGKKSPRVRSVSPATRDLENRLMSHVGAKVSVHQKDGVGHIRLYFKNASEMSQLVKQLGVQ